MSACVSWALAASAFGLDDTGPDPEHPLDARQTAEREVSMQGAIGGIGVVLAEENGKLVVSSVLPGTPADRATLKVASQIAAINGVSTAGMTIEDATKLIRGLAGTPLTLDVRDPSGAAARLEMIREKIVLGRPQSVLCRPTVGLLKLTLFNAQTPAEVAREVRQLQTQGATSLILDLRGCGGGDLQAIRDVAGLFLPKGAPLWLFEDGTSGERKLIRSPVAGEFVELPLAMLVDARTHGELPAAAIKRNNRGTIIGQTTSGQSAPKSLVKNADGTSRLVPAGRLLLYPRVPITGAGVVPDVVLPDGVSDAEFVDAALAALEKAAGARRNGPASTLPAATGDPLRPE
jgi:carboxyl-terminal processing protease